MTQTPSKAFFLKRFPTGTPTHDDFEMRDLPLDPPKDGEMLCRVVWMSVDPYMRGRMIQRARSYVPSFTLEEPLSGGAVSQVVESNKEGFAPGDYIVDFTGGWKDYYVTAGVDAQKVDPTMVSLSAYLGVLGMPGLTAWAGLHEILKPKGGETLFVSGAAGAVGSLVCQLGKAKGLRVIGSAGSPEKCAWLENEAGVDVALNYKDYEDAVALTKALVEAAPDGVDCYFENVGGMHLEAALNCINEFARIAVCGMIARYNDTELVPGPANLINIIPRRALIKGFIVSDHADKAMEFFADVAPQVAKGDIKFRESVYEGFEKAPEAFLGLFKGDNFGKAIIRIGPDSV